MQPTGFGAWVRKRRLEIGVSLRSFAIETQLDAGNLSKYERGRLAPPQDQETLARIASALKLKKDSDEYRELLDVAAASAGRIPADLAADPEVLAKMPYLFRTARGKLTRRELIALAERLQGT